jgi:hypothetical protein
MPFSFNSPWLDHLYYILRLKNHLECNLGAGTAQAVQMFSSQQGQEALSWLRLPSRFPWGFLEAPLPVSTSTSSKPTSEAWLTNSPLRTPSVLRTEGTDFAGSHRTAIVARTSWPTIFHTGPLQWFIGPYVNRAYKCGSFSLLPTSCLISSSVLKMEAVCCSET